ncbi:MAG TPA: glycosyltransferase [Thermoanaerobaculia bacterium]|nr:glycosyltransferase [Thermoanaerobaculia bacterium]
MIVAAFLSHRTIRRSLQCLQAQSLPPFEIVVCDSSPDERTVREIEAHASEAKARGDEIEESPVFRLIRSEERLLPQEARARGVEASRGELLLFTDPDVYAEPEWLERLIALHRRRRPAVVGGAIACWDRDWLNRGIHICKFARWLPGGRVRAVDNVPTACLLIARDLYDELGGFDDPYFGDAQLSRAAAAHGEVLLEPAAIAHHDHAMTFRGFLRERYRRGLRAGDEAEGRAARMAARLVVTLLPLRLLHTFYVSMLDCLRGPGIGTWTRALPILLIGQGASMAGEARGMIARLLNRRTSRPPRARATRSPSS